MLVRYSPFPLHDFLIYIGHIFLDVLATPFASLEIHFRIAKASPTMWAFAVSVILHLVAPPLAAHRARPLEAPTGGTLALGLFDKLNTRIQVIRLNCSPIFPPKKRADSLTILIFIMMYITQI